MSTVRSGRRRAAWSVVAGILIGAVAFLVFTPYCIGTDEETCTSLLLGFRLGSTETGMADPSSQLQLQAVVIGLVAAVVGGVVVYRLLVARATRSGPGTRGRRRR